MYLNAFFPIAHVSFASWQCSVLFHLLFLAPDSQYFTALFNTVCAVSPPSPVLVRSLSLLLFLPVNHWLILAFCLICLLLCNLVLKTLDQLPLSFVDMDSNIKDIRCNPRLHDLVLDQFGRHVARRRRRRWAHAPVIHAASHVDHEKRVGWVPISMHTCGPFPIIMDAPLGGPLGRRSSAINVCFKVFLILVFSFCRLNICCLILSLAQTQNLKLI